MSDSNIILDGGHVEDCRLSEGGCYRQTILWNGQYLDAVFCGNCGKMYGAALPDTTHVFVLCDACHEKWGSLPVPGEYVRAIRCEKGV